MLARGLAPVALETNGLASALQELTQDLHQLFDMSQFVRGRTRLRSQNSCVTKTMQKRAKSEPNKAKWQNILVPVDFSAAGRAAAKYAAELAERDRAKVTLVHVVATPEGKEATAAARKRLVRFCGEADLPAERCQFVVRSGIPFFEIAQAVQEHEADLIVLARSGAPNPDGRDGHTIDRVIRYSTAPVLLITDVAGTDPSRR